MNEPVQLNLLSEIPPRHLADPAGSSTGGEGEPAMTPAGSPVYTQISELPGDTFEDLFQR